MLNIDAKGILKNTGRITPIFPGIRPTTMIKKNCMTTSVLSFDSAVSLNKSTPAPLLLFHRNIMQIYYGSTSVWIYMKVQE